jgi:hypothetical protein
MAALTPTRQALDEVPNRVLTFLLAVGEFFPIRAALATKGYQEQEHEYAFSLLKKITAFSRQGTPEIDRAARDALTEVDAWDEPNFACMKATLGRLHPEQERFLFHDLEPKQGPESIMSVTTLLDRLDAMESSADRKATRKADHAALATLAVRGYTRDYLARLRELVKTAQRVVVIQPLTADDRTQALLDLHAWLTDWSTSANAVIKRRAHLVRLGLVKRKKPGKRALASSAAPGVQGARS